MTQANAPSACWLRPSVEVRKSAIHGRGLFATNDIDEGAVVGRLGGVIVTRAELLNLFAGAASDPLHPYIDCLSIYAGFDLVLPPGQAVRFGNHSCDPNIWHQGAFTLMRGERSKKTKR